MDRNGGTGDIAPTIIDENYQPNDARQYHNLSMQNSGSNKRQVLFGS
jgi:hypothetical protein